MSEPIQFSGIITPKVFRAAQRKALGLRDQLPWVFPISALYMVYTIKEHPGIPDFVFYLVAGIWGIGFGFMMHFYKIWKWNRTYSQSTYLHHLISGEFNKNGVAIVDPEGRSDIPWKNFVSVKSTSNLLLLYRGPGVCNIFSPGFFQNQAQWNEAREFSMKQISIPS